MILGWGWRRYRSSYRNLVVLAGVNSLDKRLDTTSVGLNMADSDGEELVCLDRTRFSLTS